MPAEYFVLAKNNGNNSYILDIIEKDYLKLFDNELYSLYQLN